ncbi:hypothetical protein Pla108_24910 [Botrimarina colliarenosi]|uniref:Type II secretion system protein G n=1 Tax=Botrimarina colliarenosi TaxID=2528001 RepID=A0A5C6ABH6_9BACT|nr:hypothetical protein [Botrimarina colliarenosi]TWT96717.1 hypothetical protein Pla108_24910 [Botrimarina colliarenosi]
MCDEDEILLRYHFGDMSPAELAQFEQRLVNEPELAERLQELRDCIAVNGVPGCTGSRTPPSEAPARLADRTVQAIFAGHLERASECVGRKRFNLVEVVAVGVVATFLGALILPGLLVAREARNRNVCANNLHEIGKSLESYRLTHAGHFPMIGEEENAGLFSAMLAEGDAFDREVLQRLLVCPSSELAERVAAGEVRVVVPTLETLLTERDPIELDRLQRYMGGSFAYRIGYRVDGEYVEPEEGGNCRLPLMADAPSRRCSISVVSQNHGGCGQNVLFAGGTVRFVSGCWMPEQSDHLFLNDDNEIAAGSHRGDIVLAPSGVTPLGVPFVHFGL